MTAHTIMNSPVTRIQVFAVWALCAIMLIGVLIYGALTNLKESQQPARVGGHGIETSWPTEWGENRLWSMTPGGGDYRPWLEAHIAVVKTAAELMPVKEKR